MAELIKEEDDDKKEEIVIIEDEKKVDPTEATGVEDDSKPQTENDDEVDDEDEKEREAIRERRRAEKQERKHRREDAMKRDKTELDFLRSRNDDLERRLSTQEQRAHQADLNGFDAQIRNANQDVELAEKVIAKAVEAGNGEDVTQAMRYRDQAMQRAQQLAWQKQQAAQQKPQQNQIDDMTMSHAKEFLEENSWYDSQGRDEESAIVLAVDQAMAKEGFDPRTEDYWIELRRRAAKRLPDRFEKNATQKREARGGPAVGSGREHAPASTRREIYLSPDRKEALVDAGVWDDPILRMKYVKRYAEYDRQNKK
jgi:hypothetical protein